MFLLRCSDYGVTEQFGVASLPGVKCPTADATLAEGMVCLVTPLNIFCLERVVEAAGTVKSVLLQSLRLMWVILLLILSLTSLTDGLMIFAICGYD